MKKVRVLYFDKPYPWFVRSDTFEENQMLIDPENKSGWKEALEDVLAQSDATEGSSV